MKRFVGVVLCGTALVATTVAAAGPPIALPALTATARKLSGIAARPHVHVVYENAAGMRAQATRMLDRDYPPDQQAYDQTLYRALGLLGENDMLRPALLQETANRLGLYDPLRRTLYVRKGRKVKSALIHELVHALQDKAFNLRRLSNLRRESRDAAAAAAAAVEGDAVFATRVGGRVLSGSRTVTPTPLSTFLDLEYEFPYTTGMRFIATLHNLGGNRAIFTALRDFPATTTQVFHIDAFLARKEPAAVDVPDSVGGYALAASDTFGELDLRALLATFQVSGLDRAADGWAGGRSAVYRDAAGHTIVALGLVWETATDAAQWAEAATLFVNEAFDAASPGFPPPVACAATSCWSPDGHAVAFAQDGERTALVFGSSVGDAAAVARAVAR